MARGSGRNGIPLGIGDAQRIDDIARSLGYFKRDVYRGPEILNLRAIAMLEKPAFL